MWVAQMLEFSTMAEAQISKGQDGTFGCWQSIRG
jgi:hypothetical protein